MLLTLPFDIGARVAASPSVLMLINGKCVAGFTVTEPEHAEVPAIAVSHCATCGCRAAGEIRSCIKTTCPMRARVAA